MAGDPVSEEAQVAAAQMAIRLLRRGGEGVRQSPSSSHGRAGKPLPTRGSRSCEGRRLGRMRREIYMHLRTSTEKSVVYVKVFVLVYSME